MIRQNIQLKHNAFQQTNALIFRNSTSHTIVALLQPEKNLQLRVIVVAKQSVFQTKKGQIAQFLIADETGCCYMNFFNELGRNLEEGDMLYISGAYTSYYKQMLIIYQGSMSLIRRIGRWYMKFKLDNNISLRPPSSHQKM